MPIIIDMLDKGPLYQFLNCNILIRLKLTHKDFVVHDSFSKQYMPGSASALLFLACCSIDWPAAWISLIDFGRYFFDYPGTLKFLVIACSFKSLSETTCPKGFFAHRKLNCRWCLRPWHLIKIKSKNMNWGRRLCDHFTKQLSLSISTTERLLGTNLLGLGADFLGSDRVFISASGKFRFAGSDFMHLSLVCPRMGGSGNPGELDFVKHTWVGILTSTTIPGVGNLTRLSSWKVERIWEWVTSDAPSWKIPRIHLSESLASKDGWTKVMKEYCVVF